MIASPKMSHRVATHLVLLLLLVCLKSLAFGQSLGSPGDVGFYIAPLTPSKTTVDSTITSLQMHWGNRVAGAQWLRLDLQKKSGMTFKVWMLVKSFPSADRTEAENQIERYITEEEGVAPIEFTNANNGQVVLPRHGYWAHQLPRSLSDAEGHFVFPRSISFLGHRLDFQSVGIEEPIAIPKTKRLELPCHLEIGARYDTRDTHLPRRFDKAPIETIRYLPEDYPIRLSSGQTTFNVPSDHVDLVRFENVFYIGDKPTTVSFPECLYRSNYLGPNPDYLDEPGVRTSFALQEQLKKNPSISSTISIESVLAHFESEFHHSNYANRTTRFQKALEARSDVDMGTMTTLQKNMWSWEVHLSTGAYQLRAETNGPPSAIVYEGRGAAGRDLPLFNSGTGAQIPTHDQQAWLDMIYGMMRGAARVTGKDWGIAIYGQFQVPEVFRALTYAYDLGASYFLFWTSDRGHHVPYQEQLMFSKFINDYAKHHPNRELEKLKHMAEVMILFPPGYTLLSKEPMWWLPPLNYEKKNREGLTYREVLARVAAEIERCYRQGVAYDLAWDIDGLDLGGYREIIRIRENGTISVTSESENAVYHSPRWPARPQGQAPGLAIAVSSRKGSAPMFLVAEAKITEHQSPVYFSPQHDDEGIWKNTKVIWQLYGPGPDLYRNLSHLFDSKAGILPLELEDPGNYRLRASVVDRAGRSTVRWETIVVE
jgi:hypothetical protein